MAGLPQSWEKAKLRRTPRPCGEQPGTRPACGERPRLGAPQQVRSGPRPRPRDWGAREGPSLRLLRTPSRPAPSVLAVQGSANSCFKALSLFRALRGCCSKPICLLYKYMSKEHTQPPTSG